VVDNGRGVRRGCTERRCAAAHFGLTGMRERARRIRPGSRCPPAGFWFGMDCECRPSIAYQVERSAGSSGGITGSIPLEPPRRVTSVWTSEPV